MQQRSLDLIGKAGWRMGPSLSKSHNVQDKKRPSHIKAEATFRSSFVHKTIPVAHSPTHKSNTESWLYPQEQKVQTSWSMVNTVKIKDSIV